MLKLVKNTALILSLSVLFASSTFGFSIVNTSSKNSSGFRNFYLCKNAAPAPCKNAPGSILYATKVDFYAPEYYKGTMAALPMVVPKVAWDKNTKRYETFPYVYFTYSDGTKTTEHTVRNEGCQIIITNSKWTETNECNINSK